MSINEHYIPIAQPAIIQMDNLIRLLDIHNVLQTSSECINTR